MIPLIYVEQIGGVLIVDYLLRSTDLLARITVYIRSYSGLRPMASVPMRVDINNVNMKKAPE